jgi:hypothetical protein
MKRLFAQRPSGAMAVALTALVVALGGTAMAAGTLVKGDGLIRKGSLSGNRLRAHTVTGRQISLGTLGAVPLATHALSADHATTADHATSAITAATATNAADATNATTATTAANAQALGGQAPSAYEPRVRWVQVRANGTIVAQTGGVSVFEPSSGTYFVSFPSSVLGDALSATLHLDYLQVQNGEISAAVCGASKTTDTIDPVTGQVPCFQNTSNTPNEVVLYTTASNGGGQAQGFYLEAIG